MGWSERQRRMLVEMGLPPWLAPPAPPAPAASVDGAAAHARQAEPEVGSEDHLAPEGVADDAVPIEEGVGGPPHRVAVGSTVSTALLDWEGLRAAVAGCTACGLCQGRTQTVFGAGGREARWLVVGDAPRDKEDASGEPFVGRCGPLLDNMLAALRLTRANAPAPNQVFVTNALKCRLPDHRNPLPEEFAACEGHLLRQVELLRPAVIVAVGRFAAQSMLRSGEPVGRLRARAHAFHGVPLVVTHDPAVLLRHPELKPRAWEDLCLAAELADSAATSGEPER